jgi:hypothetical protein
MPSNCRVVTTLQNSVRSVGTCATCICFAACRIRLAFACNPGFPCQGARLFRTRLGQEEKLVMKNTLKFALAWAALAAASIPVEAKNICGWYVIAACAHSKAAVEDVASIGWGSIIDTNKYSGLRRNYFCVVSGPQSRASAISDRRNSIADGVPSDAYIKRACTDERNVGD